MNYHKQIFIANSPPPPLPLSTKNSNNSAYNTMLLYKIRLNNYLESRKKNTRKKHVSKTNTTNKLQLKEASKQLSFCVHLLNEINKKIETLSLADAASSLDEKQWKEHIAELNSKLEHLSNICVEYGNKDVQNTMKTMIRKRKKKRDNIKKRKLETCVLKNYESFKRKKKHQQLNEWIEQNAEEIQKNRQKIGNQQRAEQILMDVRNRRNEAEKYITLLELLSELQRVRNTDKGYNRNEFNREINELKQMWSIASNKYEDEEKKLHTFLNESDKWEEWRNVLFGVTTQGNQRFSIRNKGNRLNNLIATRSEWDKCIVSHTNPFGSIIPFCWAYPNKNPLNIWKEYLKNT